MDRGGDAHRRHVGQVRRDHFRVKAGAKPAPTDPGHRRQRAGAEAGRDPASVALTYRVKRYGRAVPEKASDGERRLFSGTTADIVGDLRVLPSLGISAVDIDFERPDPAASIAEMRRF